MTTHANCSSCGTDSQYSVLPQSRLVIEHNSAPFLDSGPPSIACHTAPASHPRKAGPDEYLHYNAPPSE